MEIKNLEIEDTMAPKEKRAKVFCYTGTGNSFVSSRMIADALDAEIIHITEELVESKSHVDADVCVIVFPVYAYAMPKTMKRWIKNSTFDVKYMAVLGTIGSKHGGALGESIRLLKRRNCQTHYTMGLKCVENFVHMFKLPNEERIDELCKKQTILTNAIIEDLKERKENNRVLFRPESSFVSFIYRRATRLIASRYKVLDSCNGCGICYRVCPPRAITMVDVENKETSTNSKIAKIKSNKCDGCQACMQLCPQKAIKFARIHPDSKYFYKHPDAKLNELFKRALEKGEKDMSKVVEEKIKNGIAIDSQETTAPLPKPVGLSEETKMRRRSMFNDVIEMRAAELDEE
ncbi:MAG: EFR1 family ferrodoxin [Firmicutes bacterium]|nr:EFR1 family ferrodoxin [Bacillota bacterium]MCL2255719.1 EFR1 family ferrodoxin [Bacillota bacterium]